MKHCSLKHHFSLIELENIFKKVFWIDESALLYGWQKIKQVIK